jgi:hypothetical protein
MPNIPGSQPRDFAVSPENLALYEVQRPFIEPILLCELEGAGLASAKLV